MEKNKPRPDGYILRITRDEWVSQVFEKKKYYAGVRRTWEPHMTILFARKTEQGDSFLGHGIIGRVCNTNELSEEERKECEKFGWKHRLDFETISRFRSPIPIKETVLADVEARGKNLHGFPLTLAQIQSILNQTQ